MAKFKVEYDDGTVEDVQIRPSKIVDFEELNGGFDDESGSKESFELVHFCSSGHNKPFREWLATTVDISPDDDKGKGRKGKRRSGGDGGDAAHP